MGSSVAAYHKSSDGITAKHDASRAIDLVPLRIGAVHYLNAAPLTRGLENEILFDKPSTLARMLRNNELDAALVSIAEALFHDDYHILDGTAIGTLGEVKSVILAHHKPIEQVREVYCDTASLTSVNLLRVILAERGLKPEFKPLSSYDFSVLPDFVLLIGDPAIDFILSSHSCSYGILDLGSAWVDMTGLPFVFAVWVLRRGIETSALRQRLTAARRYGLDTLDSVVRERPEYSQEFRKEYLGRHIHYSLGLDQKRGIGKFIELLRKHTTSDVYSPTFVSEII